MTTPRGRPEQVTRPAEKRGRVLLRDATKDPADVPSAAEGDDTTTSEIKSIVARQRTVYTWWSEVQETVTFTTSAAVKSLPNVVLVDLPENAIIERVIGLFKFRQVEDTSATLNDLNIACGSDIEMRETGGTFIDAIDLVDQQFQVPASERGPGDVLIGDIDLTCELNGNTTYNFQFASIASTGSNLLLRDVQTGIQVMWG